MKTPCVMKTSGLLMLCTLFSVVQFHSQTLAQENEVYIGQSGSTNEIDVDQYGRSNKIGSDSISIYISQNGSANDISISQTGYANQVGAASSSGSLGLVGIYQTGSENIIEIEQHNANSEGSNQIGAISQQAPSTTVSTSNRLTIVQNDNAIDGTNGSGDGQGGHQIGEIEQTQAGSSATENFISIAQHDGASGTQSGNLVEQILQQGSGNIADINQQSQANQLGLLEQYGEANQLVLSQQSGMNNRMVNARQIGFGNRSQVHLIGSRNLLLYLIQNNDLVSASGNIITLNIAGDDNGGDGMGGLGQFVFEATRQIEVAQAEILQLGDDNMLNFVTSSMSETNLYGFLQDGDGNWLSGTVSGSENEVAIVESGDGNRLDFAQTGVQNTLAVSISGDDNHLDVAQAGNDNILSMSMEEATAPSARSDRNNDPALGGFSETISVPLGEHAQSLLPGRIVQSGSLNVIEKHIRVGSDNRFAFLQTGSQNTISGETTGHANQVAIAQTGQDNIAYYHQTGNNNQLVILQ